MVPPAQFLLRIFQSTSGHLVGAGPLEQLVRAENQPVFQASVSPAVRRVLGVIPVASPVNPVQSGGDGPLVLADPEFMLDGPARSGRSNEMQGV